MNLMVPSHNDTEAPWNPDTAQWSQKGQPTNIKCHVKGDEAYKEGTGRKKTKALT